MYSVEAVCLPIFCCFFVVSAATLVMLVVFFLRFELVPCAVVVSAPCSGSISEAEATGGRCRLLQLTLFFPKDPDMSSERHFPYNRINSEDWIETINPTIFGRGLDS